MTQTHITPQEADFVWVPKVKDPRGKLGERAKIKHVGKGGAYVVLQVGRDQYDFNQFPGIEQIYGDHPESVGTFDDFFVVLDEWSKRPLKDTPRNASLYRKWRAACHEHRWGRAGRLLRKIEFL